MARASAIWATVLCLTLWPLVIAASSPLLAYRDAIYIAAGLAGVIALALLLLQPLLMAGLLPGLRGPRGRRLHRWIGGGLILAVVVHVGALWLTSPPDVVDALTFRSPTPFSAWGVVAMWAVFATGALALARSRLTPRSWRRAHLGLAVVIATGTVVHALLIEGSMGTLSKVVLCAAVVAATAKLIFYRRAQLGLGRRNA